MLKNQLGAIMQGGNSKEAMIVNLTNQNAELSRQLAPETFVKLSREFAELNPVIEKVKAYRNVAAEIAGLDPAGRS